MNSFEYWILENVVSYVIEVDWLNTSGEDFGMMFNRRFHNETQHTCLSTLEKLLQQNYIYLCQQDPDTYHLSLLPSTKEVLEEAFFNRGSKILYALTAEGGSAWEHVSQANWNKYINEGIFLGRDLHFKFIECLDRHILEKKLEVYPYSSMDSVIDPETIEWTVRKPWEATYWKTFPIGYYVRFQSISRPPSDPMPEWIKQYIQEDETWYINPFDS